MLFPTVEFAIFFLIVFALSWSARPWPLVRKLILLVASYIFYGWWDWRFAFLLLECSLVNYLLGLWLDGLENPRSRKRVLIGAIVFNLGMLGFFKYWGFFLASLSDVLNLVGWGRDIKIMNILLPAGISFFTFQGISYIVDVYRKEMRAATSPIDFLLFISFFPHLVAGPIVRARDFLPQLHHPANAAKIRAGLAFLLIGLGLFKKVVIAHYLSIDLVNPIFEDPISYSTIDLLFGAYGYAVQIYCDFSAYSDMAIGFAALLGFEFKKNFDQPYRSASLREFWRRWHISLSSWLRDYLFIPLGGSRCGPVKNYRNLFLTMLLGGLWHGAAWNFVVWGALHGGGLALEKAVGEKFSRVKIALPSFIRIFLVFHFVCLAWIFFAADNFALASEYLVALGNIGLKTRLISKFTFTLLVVGMIGQFLPPLSLLKIENLMARVPLVWQGALAGVAIVVMSALSAGALAPFIYFRF